jgi:hypothetical protein
MDIFHGQNLLEPIVRLKRPMLKGTVPPDYIRPEDVQLNRSRLVCPTEEFWACSCRLYAEVGTNNDIKSVKHILGNPV